jgi:energy-coupling factor transporter transmembrane protein EcfT
LRFRRCGECRFASEGTEESHQVPGSPKSDDASQPLKAKRALHPLAWILSLALLGAGLMMTRSSVLLLIAAAVLGFLCLRVERKRARDEAPILLLAAIVSLAHVLGAGKDWARAVAPAATIALRLLALLYLLRWAARVALGAIARWLMARRPPARPRVLLLLIESARLTAGLLPLALRESEQHVAALRARGIRPGRGLQGRARYLLAWFLPFLGTMLRVGEAYADALMVRGYVPGRARRSGLRARWSWPEWGTVAGCAGTCAFLVRGF